MTVYSILMEWVEYFEHWDGIKPIPARLIVGLHPANERRRYKVTSSLIGWAQT